MTSLLLIKFVAKTLSSGFNRHMETYILSEINVIKWE